jgi:hypothetical protein
MSLYINAFDNIITTFLIIHLGDPKNPRTRFSLLEQFSPRNFAISSVTKSSPRTREL